MFCQRDRSHYGRPEQTTVTWTVTHPRAAASTISAHGHHCRLRRRTRKRDAITQTRSLRRVATKMRNLKVRRGRRITTALQRHNVISRWRTGRTRSRVIVDHPVAQGTRKVFALRLGDNPRRSFAVSLGAANLDSAGVSYHGATADYSRAPRAPQTPRPGAADRPRHDPRGRQAPPGRRANSQSPRRPARSPQ